MAPAQTDSIKHRIFLIGDAGEMVGNTHPVIDWLKKNVEWDDARNTVLYLGDNIYPYGLPAEGDPTYPQSKRILDYEISLVKDKKSRAYFLPGNHDWKNGKIGGWETVKNQDNYIRTLDLKNVEFWPQDGCPGPVEINMGDSVTLIIMDSQWWLHTHDKPGLESHCDCKTPDEVTSVLEEMVISNKDKLVIVAMHHPLYSYGVHGGNYTLRHHIFPLTEVSRTLYIPMPIIGSIYPVARGVFGNIQDVKHPTYRTMIRDVEGILKKHPNAVHVAGHDHGLQMLMKDSIPYIVSGSGSNLSRVKTGPRSLYMAANFGFAVLEVYKSGKVFTKFYTLNNKGLNDPDFTKELKPIVQPEKLEVKAFVRAVALPDSVLWVGNPTLKGNWFRNFFLGKNYRDEWTTPVKVKVLDIDKEHGGLKPVKLGGGKQTRTLRLVDPTGKEYSLRSIKKFPAPAMPVEFRETFVKDLVEDGISASYPYASLSMGPITSAVGVPYLRTQLVFVPADTALGRYREDFENSLCMLEEREPIYINKTYNTDELTIRLLKDNDDHVNQKGVLMSRMLDMYIMDFDRHEDQWRWFTTDTGRGKIYNPIPKDRDQAFFVNQGLIPSMMKKRPLIPDIQGFRKKAYNIKTFNKSARNFDRSFLNELDETVWMHMADSFLTRMTDDVIERSLALQPKEIKDFNAGNIIKTLKERRQYLKNDLLTYYRFISKIVSIPGSNQKELFTVNRNDDGTVLVTVNKIDKEGAISSKIYERLFQPAITRELRLYGMGGDDKFVLNGTGNSILVRVIGGAGLDEFNSEGSSTKTIVYDASFEKNTFTGNKNYRNKVSTDPTVNDYNRLSYRYNLFNSGIYAAYNLDDGLILGLDFLLTTHGFRKDPFKQQQRLTMGYALSTKSYNFKYNGILTKVLGTADLVFRADIRAPVNVKNFFGLGNLTQFDRGKSGRRAEYYRARYNTADVSVFSRKTMQSWMYLYTGLTFQYYHLDSLRNKGKFVNDFSINGLDPNRVHARKTFLGPALSLEIDNRNNKVLPTRGAKMNIAARTLFGLNKNTSTVTQLNFDLTLYISIIEETKTVFATRFGVGHNIGKYDFFQAQTLGGNENLRGFHNYRFAGRTRFFNNSELRIQLAQFRTYFFPGAFGMMVFTDVGKVTIPSQTGNGQWHFGYGAGLYVSPLKKFIIAFSAMRSKEGTLPLLTFGFQF